jgi:hypothetical protein
MKISLHGGNRLNSILSPKGAGRQRILEGGLFEQIDLQERYKVR